MHRSTVAAGSRHLGPRSAGREAAQAGECTWDVHAKAAWSDRGLREIPTAPRARSRWPLLPGEVDEAPVDELEHAPVDRLVGTA